MKMKRPAIMPPTIGPRFVLDVDLAEGVAVDVEVG